MSTNTNKLNVPLTINECYGILTVIDKHRTSSERIIYGENNEFETSAYNLSSKIRNIIVNEEDKQKGKKDE